MIKLPSWEDFNVPTLSQLSDGRVQALRDLTEGVAVSTNLSPDQRADVLPSGQLKYANRIGWAASYLYRVGALNRPKRGHYEITDFGRELAAKHPVRISEIDLRRLAKPGDEWWVNRRAPSTGEMESIEIDSPPLDPREQVEEGMTRIHDEIKADILRRLREKDPAFFEQAVVQLLVAMGYGGTGGTAAATSLVGDGGIDGVIDQDVLGLSKIYVQAKRNSEQNTVQRPDVQAFVGALSGKAEQGVFITTSRFSAGAVEYAERDARVRVILIDGVRLSDLMIRFGVGVQVKQTLRIVEIDEDFFE